MLKTAYYLNNGRKRLSVVYTILKGNLCIFSAMDEAWYGSSINYAEEIACAITRQEDRAIFDLRWFDLQTRKSYGKDFPRPRPGDYDLDEVRFIPYALRTDGIVADAWIPTRCPPHIEELFRERIDGPPHQVIVREPQSVDF